MRKGEMTALKWVGPIVPEALPGSTSVTSVLARNLREAIARGEFAVGSSLPSERELMLEHQVSRATVREALRILSAQELIQVKRGRSGGSFISSPTSHSVV